MMNIKSFSFPHVKHQLFKIALASAWITTLTACGVPAEIANVTGFDSTAEYANNSGNSETTSAAIGALLMINGNNQTVTQGLPATKNLSVLAVDSNGLPKQGVTVTFKLIETTLGSLSTNSETGLSYTEVTTDSSGIASVGFTAGSTIGSASVIATSSTGSAVFNLLIGSTSSTSSSGSIMLATGGNNQGVIKGSAAANPLEVLILNSSGSEMSGVSVKFEVVSTGMGTLTGGGTIANVTTGANGRATVNFTAANINGPVSIVASSSAGSAIFNLNVYTAGTATSNGSSLLLTSGNNQLVSPSSAASKSLEVIALNSLGTPIQGLTINYEILSSGAGTLTGGNTTASVLTGSDGRASVGFTASSNSGTVTVIARSTAGNVVFNLQVGTTGNTVDSGAMLLAANGNNQTVEKSAAAGKSLEVLAINNQGIPLSGITVTFELITTGAGTLTGASSGNTTLRTGTTDANGRTSVNFTASSSTGTASIVARSTAGSAVFNLNVVSSVNNTSQAPMLLVTNGNNQSVVKGTTAGTDLEVLALNSAGAPIEGLSISFTVATTGSGTLNGSGTTATDTTDADGKATVSFDASSTFTGSATIVAISNAGNVGFNLQVVNTPTPSTTALGSQLLVTSGNNQTIEKNTLAGSELQVLALNSEGTPISGLPVTFTVATSGAGTFTGGNTTFNTTTNGNGKASAFFTAGNTAMAATIIATSTAGSAVFNEQIIAPVTPTTNTLGSALLITAGNNQVLEQNTAAPLSLEVMAVNSSGSPISNISVTFQVSSGSFTGGGTTKTLTTDANGKASTGFTPGSQLGPISVIATSSAGSNVFNLTVGTQGAGSTLSISGGNGQLLLPNSTASNPLEVIATNSTGAPLANIPVTFTVTTTNGGVLSTNQLLSVTINTDSSGKASTTFKSSNYVGTVSILASSQIGSVTFSLNTNTITNGSSGSGAVLVFSPTTLSPATGTWVTTEVGSAPSKSISLTNAAATSVYLNSIFTTTQVPFKISSDNCPRSPTPFAPNANCTINIQFAPQTSGTFNRSLFVNWSALNDGSNGANAVLSLEGSGPEPLIFGGLTSASNTTTTQTQLNWVAASGGTNTQYRIYDVTSTAALIATLTPNSTSYTVTGLTPNSVYKYKAYAVNTAGVEDGNTSVITVTTGALSGPALTIQTNFVYPATYIRASYDTVSANIDSAVSNTDTGPNGVINYVCKYSRVVNGTSTSKVACTQSSLGGSFTFGSGTAQLNWTPKFGTQGVYEFQITGTDSVGSTAQYFTVNVIHPYGSANQGTLNLSTIIADYRASFANRTNQNATTATTWLNTLSTNYSATISGNPNFNGSTSNTATDPERLTFDGSTAADFGQVLAGMKTFMLDYWVSNPESTFTNGSTVLKMDTDATDNGFSVTQNTLESGQRALRFNFDRSYRRVILADNPVAYWRMDETSGTSVADVIGTNNLTIADTSNNASNVNVTYALTGATQGETSSTAISIHTNRILVPNVATVKPASTFSVEMWVRYPNRPAAATHDLYNFSTASTSSGFSMQVINGVLTVKYKPASASTVTLTQNPNSLTFGQLFDSNWHHLVFTSTSNNKILYFDGMTLASDTANNGSISWPTTPDNNWVTSAADSANPVQIDEVAIYNTALTANQVLNHLSAGDHFTPKQTYYPATTQLQSRPIGFWRFSEPGHTNQVTQDYSGNQADAINYNGWTYYTAQGPYNRSGGSGLDPIGASYYADYYIDPNQSVIIHNNRHLSFNQKFTFSEWVNFSFNGNNRRFPLFNTRNTVTSYNNWGITAYANNDGKILVGFNCTQSAWCSNYAITATSVVPIHNGATLNGNLRTGWTHIAITFDGTQPAANRVQVYVFGVPVQMATPIGTIPSTLSGLTGPINTYSAYDWLLNSVAGTSRLFDSINYAFADFALYQRALSASEIRAQAYEGSLRYCDVPVTSVLQDPSNSKPFDYINMLFNTVQSTGQLQVYRNSKLECALRPGVNLTSESLNLVAGSTSNGFKGHLTDLRVHGSSTDSVAAITNTHKAFMNSADQHRVVPLGNIVTDNLVRAYEPATAMDGMRPYATGNEDFKLQWQENGNMASGTRQEPGYLRGFAGYAGKWNGTGIPTDPYRLTFDGNGWVDLGSTPLFELSNKNFTVCIWEKTTQTSGSTLFHKGNISTNFGNISMGIWNGQLFLGVNTGYWYYPGTPYNIYKNGSWHYICARTDGSNASLWIDGTNYGNQAYTSAINQSGTIGGDRMGLGYYITRRYESNQYGGVFVGDMGGVHIYNSALTDAQIKSNCAAQAANYNMSTCAP